MQVVFGSVFRTAFYDTVEGAVAKGVNPLLQVPAHCPYLTATMLD